MDFKFSIIIAVYNTEQYLEETIQSVVNQTCGFENIELILVNDGSEDGSAAICRKYREQYPENVRFIDKENEGVSASRNKGLDIANGQIINFLDSDDLLDSNACEKVEAFFKKHGDKTDVVSIPMRFFDAKEGEHGLNYKYTKTRVIDLSEELSAIQLSSSSAFIKAEALRGLRFHEGLRYGEDAEIITKILLEKQKLGVIKGTVYWYRRRQEVTSAIQEAVRNRDYYLSYTIDVQDELFQYSLNKFGYYPRYIQYLFLYDMKWRICKEQPPKGILSEEEQELIEAIVQKILKHVDTDVILTHKALSWKDKEYFLGLKNGRRVYDLYEYVCDKENNDVLAVIDHHIIDSLSKRRVWIQNIEIKENRILFEGTWSHDFVTENTACYVVTEEESYPLEQTDGWIRDSYCWGHETSKPYYFRTPWLPLETSGNFFFEVEEFGLRIRLKIAFGATMSYLNQPWAFRLLNGYVVSQPQIEMIQVQRAAEDLINAMEANYEEYLERGIADPDEKAEIIALRRDYLQSYYFKAHKTIWLFSDRVDAADDNGEHLFRYCRKHAAEYPDVEMYFVVEKASPHFERMKQYGTVIDYYSYECKELLLRADLIISSQANLVTYSSFGKNYRYLKGLQEHKKIFLQHGIIKDDMSKWLHRWNKELDIFVTSSPYEYESVLRGRYGYCDRQVKLTGLPRFDNLRDQQEKVILFMPTWDTKLAKYDMDRVQIYNSRFRESELFEEINSLLTSKRLEEMLEEYGYSFVMKPHPNLLVQISDFTLSEHMSIAGWDVSYQEVYKKGALLITDYSSAQFDFAYMKKPVLYLQMRENHLETGYYDYRTMGFGEVRESMDELLDDIERYLKNGCRMNEIYASRVDDFFAYTDHDNCRRVSNILKEFI